MGQIDKTKEEKEKLAKSNQALEMENKMKDELIKQYKQKLQDMFSFSEQDNSTVSMTDNLVRGEAQTWRTSSQ